MTILATATLCFIVTDASPGSTATCLEPFLDVLLAQSVPLRVLLSQAPVGRHYVLGRLCPVSTYPTRTILPYEVERLSWTVRGGIPVHVWIATSDHAEGALTNLLLTDVPATTDYILWFDACYLLKANWWELLLPLFDNKLDLLGCPAWVDYSPADIERMQCHPWFRGVPLERRNGRPGVAFMNHFWGLRTACFQEIAGTGERNWNRWSSEQPGGCPVLLGEIARQLNWSRADYDPTLRGAAIPSTESRV